MVFYFSGTGNSRAVAQYIAEGTQDRLLSINEWIKEGKEKSFSSDRPLVFVAPTYGWRMPRLVEDFIREATFHGNQQAYFILTCGASSLAAVDFVHKLCHQKDFTFMGYQEVVLPENYVALFQTPEQPEAQRLFEKAFPVVEEITRAVQAQLALAPTTSSGKIMSYLVNPLFYTFVITDRGFQVTPDCIACGDCVQLCPLNNVELSPDGTPRWLGNCTHCMACICGCPSEAIEYQRVTCSHGKPRYFLHHNPFLSFPR